MYKFQPYELYIVGLLLVCFIIMYSDTLPETNITPENRTSQKAKSPNPNFSGAMRLSGSVNAMSIMSCEPDAVYYVFRALFWGS